jgi:antitoxin HicB
MKYHFEIHKEGDGYWAKCLELHGCRTEAETFDRLLENMKEALDLFLDEPAESDMEFPAPNPMIKAKGVVAIPVSPSIALALTLKNTRKRHQMTQKETAEAMGLKGLYSYQRLESSKTANPELATLDKIKSVFPEINFDFIIQGTSRKNTHVIPLQNGWGVISESNYKDSGMFKTQEAAIRAARSLSKNSTGEITIQGKDGLVKSEKVGRGATIDRKSRPTRSK